MAITKKPGISFQLSKEQASALKVIGGERMVRLAGKVNGGTFQVDFIACNAPFSACNSSFASCNSSFASCNSSFTKTAKNTKSIK
jgi:hypothetical protein